MPGVMPGSLQIARAELVHRFELADLLMRWARVVALSSAVWHGSISR